ncbi:MAG TPA: hypothetical protein VJ894_02580 [Cryomorphaceae bacterium]|nr:hypothetical protein [Cryomorphaceae bacterium]
MRLSVLFAVLLMCFLCKAQRSTIELANCLELSPTEKSKLVIEVNTNVNTLECTFDQDVVFKELHFEGMIEDRLITFENGLLCLPVLDFDCGGSIINKDFANLLNYHEHSDIQVSFKNAHWYEKEKRIKNIQRGLPIGYFTVELTIAGHSKEKRLRIFSSHMDRNILFSRGSLELNMTEFGIAPPEKFLGMVKVKDSLIIRFDLKIKVLS